jgi:UrcA family protein
MPASERNFAMTRFSPIALAAALIATGVTLAPAASATTIPNDSDVMVVHYGDLDLSSERGRTMLDRRIRRAVDDVCHVHAVRDIDLIRRCRESVMSTVQPAVQFAVRASADRVASADSSIRAVLR